MSKENSCACSAAPKLIFACSGAADVGALSDQAARKLTREGAGKMYCLAGIGGRVSGILKTTETAARILAIDGCPLNCVKNCLEQAGFTKFERLQLADLGLEKGRSPVNDENTARVCEAGGKALLGSAAG
jgi:uncharacterized metal-binding protein